METYTTSEFDKIFRSLASAFPHRTFERAERSSAGPGGNLTQGGTDWAEPAFARRPSAPNSIAKSLGDAPCRHRDPVDFSPDF